MRTPERSTTSKRVVVDRAEALPEGEFRILKVGRREIGVCRTPRGFVALKNLCPHMGAPLCRGEVTGTFAPSKPQEYRWEREGEILRCPWHAYEFDLLTGRALHDPRLRVKTYPVAIEDGMLVVYV